MSAPLTVAGVLWLCTHILQVWIFGLVLSEASGGELGSKYTGGTDIITSPSEPSLSFSWEFALLDFGVAGDGAPHGERFFVFGQA